MHEIQESGEMYLETILILSNQKANVRSIDVANYMNYSKPSVSDGNRYIMWQYTSKGRINGVNGNVDRSKLMNGHTIYDIIYP